MNANPKYSVIPRVLVWGALEGDSLRQEQLSGHSLLLGGQSLEREGTLRDDPQDDLRNNPPGGYLL